MSNIKRTIIALTAAVAIPVSVASAANASPNPRAIQETGHRYTIMQKVCHDGPVLANGHPTLSGAVRWYTKLWQRQHDANRHVGFSVVSLRVDGKLLFRSFVKCGR